MHRDWVAPESGTSIFWGNVATPAPALSARRVDQRARRRFPSAISACRTIPPFVCISLAATDFHPRGGGRGSPCSKDPTCQSQAPLSDGSPLSLGSSGSLPILRSPAGRPTVTGANRGRATRPRYRPGRRALRRSPARLPAATGRPSRPPTIITSMPCFATSARSQRVTRSSPRPPLRTVP